MVSQFRSLPTRIRETGKSPPVWLPHVLGETLLSPNRLYDAHRGYRRRNCFQSLTTTALVIGRSRTGPVSRGTTEVSPKLRRAHSRWVTCRKKGLPPIPVKVLPFSIRMVPMICRPLPSSPIPSTDWTTFSQVLPGELEPPVSHPSHDKIRPWDRRFLAVRPRAPIVICSVSSLAHYLANCWHIGMLLRLPDILKQITG